MCYPKEDGWHVDERGFVNQDFERCWSILCSASILNNPSDFQPTVDPRMVMGPPPRVVGLGWNDPDPESESEDTKMDVDTDEDEEDEEDDGSEYEEPSSSRNRLKRKSRSRSRSCASPRKKSTPLKLASSSSSPVPPTPTPVRKGRPRNVRLKQVELGTSSSADVKRPVPQKTKNTRDPLAAKRAPGRPRSRPPKAKPVPVTATTPQA
ncbi:hypothetical protein CTheo_1545 [Ceratobasidium theobromae]|uniref:Uncharacterized protein n=1 Tax=Ceratobasidium theobromae TaxID=1582974 RepID=A0A5N5QTS4_9AGAM|nr:hypothetical protein CTheo_1545 [Ceratobasidium theobromae]